MHLLQIHAFTIAITCILEIKPTQSQDAQNICPESCFCNQHSKIVYCARRNLQRIPTESLPSYTRQLNVNGNIFQSSVIKRSNFSGLSLEHLYMSKCGIETIEVDTFSEFGNLLLLDLSDNRIKFIEEFTFSGLAVKHLFLSGNRHINLRKDSFAGLTTLGLYLHDCFLTQLDFEAFKQMNQSLRNFWLNGNQLKTINKEFQQLFTNSQDVRLGFNPFHCDCELKWLKLMYDENARKFEDAHHPYCQTPMKLRNAYFKNVSAIDFKCKPPVFKNVDVIYNGTDVILQCSASGDPTPKLSWTQPSGFITYYEPPSNNPDHNLNQAVSNISSVASKHNGCSGEYICMAVNGGGNATFTLNVTCLSSGSLVSFPDFNLYLVSIMILTSRM